MLNKTQRFALYAVAVAGFLVLLFAGSRHVYIDSYGEAPLDRPSSYDDSERHQTVVEKPVIIGASELWVGNEFPHKVWHKVGPKGLDENKQKYMDTWFEKNPTYRHEVMYDDAADTYVYQNYAHRPDILQVWKEVTIPMLKVDLLKYLIMYKDGGIWSDLDVICHEPVPAWIPEEFKDKTDVVVGMEIDWGKNHNPISAQFASWTVMSKPGLSHFDYIINDTVRAINDLATENKVKLSEITMKMIKDVVHLTGPKRMTWGLVKGMSELEGYEVTDKELGDLEKPTLFGNILLHPGRAFAAKTESNRDNPKHGSQILVEHLYEGSWRNSNGGDTKDKK